MKFIIPVQQQIGIAYLVDFVNPFKPYNIQLVAGFNPPEKY